MKGSHRLATLTIVLMIVLAASIGIALAAVFAGQDNGTSADRIHVTFEGADVTLIKELRKPPIPAPQESVSKSKGQFSIVLSIPKDPGEIILMENCGPYVISGAMVALYAPNDATLEFHVMSSALEGPIPDSCPFQEGDRIILPISKHRPN